MKIVETIRPDNAKSVIMGPKNVTISYDTETGKIGLNTPAIWGGDAEMDLSTLREALARLEAYGATAVKPHGEHEERPISDFEVGDFFHWDGLYRVAEKNEHYVEAHMTSTDYKVRFYDPKASRPEDSWTWDTLAFSAPQ